MAAIPLTSLPQSEPTGATSLRMVDVQSNTYKWWRVAWWGETHHQATWGRIGHPPDGGAWSGGQRVARGKINDKLKKGYKIVADSELQISTQGEVNRGVLLLDLEFTTPDRLTRLTELLESAVSAPTPATLNAFLSEAPVRWHGALTVNDVARYLKHNRETIRTFLGSAQTHHAQARISGNRVAHIWLEQPSAANVVAAAAIRSPGRQILDDWGDD